MQESIIEWHGATNTRVPFGIYTDTANADQEQQRIYRGEVWNYLCLESEIPGAGDFRTTFAGETPIVVVRDADQEIYAFENRCAHRGALIALEKSGRTDSFQCVYHAWSYNRQG
ncbi:Rieske 2Fe-2S domain-containing protein, partial [Comamonas thiooxydans]